MLFIYTNRTMINLPGCFQEVLKGFSLQIPRGRTVALVGSSGGGNMLVSLIIYIYYITISHIIIIHIDKILFCNIKYNWSILSTQQVY